jgi:hypothetical protein
LTTFRRCVTRYRGAFSEAAEATHCARKNGWRQR